MVRGGNEMVVRPDRRGGVLAIGSAIYNFAATATEVKDQAARLDKLEADLKDTRKESHEEAIHLREWVIERAAAHTHVSALVYDGEVARATEASVTIKTTGPKASDEVFAVTGETEVTIKGVKSKPGDLKPGMAVHVVAGEDGKAMSIDADKK